MATLLSDIEIQRELANLPGWVRRGPTLVRTFECRQFAAAIAFVDRVAQAAEQLDHHPDIDIRYSRVTFSLSTHSAGGITKRDLLLAAAIDEAFGKAGG